MAKSRKTRKWIVALAAAVAVGLGLYWWGVRDPKPPFSGERALQLVRKQVAFGPRVPGTSAHEKAKSFFLSTLRKYAERVGTQPFSYPIGGDTLRGANIIASFNPKLPERILLAAHWDSRPRADQERDTSLHQKPVPGANDGASGTAVLLELARHLSKQPPGVGVDIVLFDMEDMGTGEPSDSTEREVPYAIGSKYFAEHRQGYRPDYGILLDIVCDKHLRIPKEGYSVRYAGQVVRKVWEAAEEVGASAFVDERGRAVMDDHVPLLREGIPMIDLIQTPFPWYWHTTKDTPDKCSAESLDQVGEVLTEVVYDE